jgi:hypothetical protein
MNCLKEVSEESSLTRDAPFSFAGLLKESSLSDFSLLATNMLRPVGGGHDGDAGQLGRLCILIGLFRHYVSTCTQVSSSRFSLLASQLFTVVYVVFLSFSTRFLSGSNLVSACLVYLSP